MYIITICLNVNNSNELLNVQKSVNKYWDIKV